jgi:NitT/TauT family transport system substrate-binding protein
MADKTALNIGHIQITDHLILGVAKAHLESGRETLQTCTLGTQAFLGWNQLADALTAGQIDGAFVLAPTAMDLYKSGVNSKLILFTHRAGSILIKNKAAGVENIEDFKGKVVLIPYQLSVHNMLFHRLLAEKGLTPGTGKDAGVDVLLEVMAPTMMPEAIQYDEEGEIAGFIVAEPIGSQAVAAGFGEEMALSKDLWPNHPCCVFVMRDEVIGRSPDAVAELTAALVRAGQFVEDEPEAAAAIGADFLKQKPEVIEKVLTLPPDRITTGSLYPKIEDLAIMQDYLCDNMGLIKTKVDLEKFVDTRFAEAASAW